MNASARAPDTDPGVALVRAAIRGDADAARSALAASARAHAAREPTLGAAPLHLAAHRGHLAVVDVLLEAGADVNAREACSGATPLHWACEGGHAAVAERLVRAGAALEARDAWMDMTPMDWTGAVDHAPCRRGDRDATARRLLELGARPSLWRAIARDDPDAVAAMLRDGAPMRPAGPARDGETPLHFAARRAGGRVIAALCRGGADPAAMTVHGVGALGVAALHARGAAQEALERAGARPDLATLLARGQWRSAERVLRARPGVLDRPGTAFRLVVALAAHGRADAVEWLLARGADADATAPALGPDDWIDDYSAVHAAARAGHAAVIEVLAAARARLDAASPESRLTPLHLAAGGGHLDAVRVLLAAGVRTAVRDARHHATPLEWALAGGHEDVARELAPHTPSPDDGEPADFDREDTP